MENGLAFQKHRPLAKSLVIIWEKRDLERVSALCPSIGRLIEFNLFYLLSYPPSPVFDFSRESRGMRIHISLFNLLTRPWMNVLRNSSLFSLRIRLLFPYLHSPTMLS